MPTNSELNKAVGDLTENLDKVVESTNDAIDGVNETIKDMDQKFDQKLGEVSSTLAKTIQDMLKGYSPSHGIEAQEQDLGASVVSEFADTDPYEDSVILTPNVDSVHDPLFKIKVDELAFMEEPITVFIHETAERDAEQVFSIGVNGKQQLFKRGQQITVRRKFVEGLARAKPIHYVNEEYVNGKGENAVRYPSSRGLRYSFQVVEDRNPRGPSWLSSVLSQP